MKTAKIILSLVLCVAMMTVLCVPFASAEKKDDTSEFVLVNGLEAIKEKGVLTVGLMAAIPPYEFHYIDDKGNDEIIGSDIELIKAISEALGVDYEIKDMEFSGLLESRRIAGLLAGSHILKHLFADFVLKAILPASTAVRSTANCS